MKIRTTDVTGELKNKEIALRCLYPLLWLSISISSDSASMLKFRSRDNIDLGHPEWKMKDSREEYPYFEEMMQLAFHVINNVVDIDAKIEIFRTVSLIKGK